MMAEDGLGVEHVAKNDRSIYLSVVSVLVELVELLISILTNIWWRTQIRQKIIIGAFLISSSRIN